MKKFIFILSIFLIVPTAFIFASCNNYDNKENASIGFSYELSSDMNSYAISGIGDCIDKEIIFPTSHNGLPIVEIKENAFKNNIGLESISIPKTITIIGKNAFSNCSNLKTIKVQGIKKYIDSFDGSTNIENVKIDNVDNWCLSKFSSSKANPLSNGAKLFENNKEINSLSTYSQIGDFAFYNYKHLSNINFLSNTQIGISAFANNDLLENIYFGGSVIAKHEAFDNCTNIKKVSVNNLSIWTLSTFETKTSNPIYYSQNLYTGTNEVKEITIQTNSLSKYLFVNCSSIENINIMHNINNIGKDAFYGCTSIKNVKINTLRNWLNVKLENVYSTPAYYADNVYVNNSLITELLIPDDITQIGQYRFFGWKTLKNLYVSNAVKEIEIGAFGGCNQLNEISIPFIGKCAIGDYF